MKLLTKTLLDIFQSIWSQQDESDPIIIAKYFHVCSPWTWYASEYDPEEKLFFWFVDGDFPERWYFSLREFEELCIIWLWMERDLHFEPCRFSELKLSY